jgi:outer membrane protein OmpA-like peptidoglycan-associated protein
MSKSKAKAEAKETPVPAIQKQPETPEKTSGPRQAPWTAAAASAPNGIPSNGGAAGRARRMHDMQRAVGNTHISRLPCPTLQAKLTVNEPCDPCEQEADRVAGQVMRTPVLENEAQQAELPSSHLQRWSVDQQEGRHQARDRGDLCPGCGQLGEDADSVQRQTAGPDIPTVTPEIESYLQSTKHGGRSVPSATRKAAEDSLNRDLSGARVHDDTAANEAADALSARAFTHDSDIYLARGESTQDRKLLGHELAHVVQQTGPRPLSGGNETVHRAPNVQRVPACPRRPRGESQQSRQPDGFLADNVVFSESAHRLYIQDFAVNSATLPPNVTTESSWQRVMSYIAGDPSIRVSVTGYTDCVGTQAENLSLRRRRAEAVIAAMPQNVQSKVLTRGAYSANDFLASNTTSQGRARNRSATIYYLSAAPPGQESCDMVSQASNLDEYIFLVRCLERRLGLTDAQHTATALSVLRQIYYGSATWSASQTSIWNDVITNRRWSPGTDPSSRLGRSLFDALRNSQVVEGTDIGHLMTGLDAMMNPQDVAVSRGRFQLQTGLANEEWATWAGDVGSAAAMHFVDAYYQTLNGSYDDYFNRWAGAADLLGNIDSFAMRAGLNQGTPPQQLGQRVRLRGSLSEMMLQYYRLTSSGPGQARAGRVRDFMMAYGGVVAGNTLTNHRDLISRLRPSVDEFARLFSLQEWFRRGDPPTRPQGSPSAATLLDNAIDAMTRRFVDWLVGQLPSS